MDYIPFYMHCLLIGLQLTLAAKAVLTVATVRLARTAGMLFSLLRDRFEEWTAIHF